MNIIPLQMFRTRVVQFAGVRLIRLAAGLVGTEDCVRKVNGAVITSTTRRTVSLVAAGSWLSRTAMLMFTNCSVPGFGSKSAFRRMEDEQRACYVQFSKVNIEIKFNMSSSLLIYHKDRKSVLICMLNIHSYCSNNAELYTM